MSGEDALSKCKHLGWPDLKDECRDAFSMMKIAIGHLVLPLSIPFRGPRPGETLESPLSVTWTASPSTTTSIPLSHWLQPVSRMTCGLLLKLMAFCSVGRCKNGQRRQAKLQQAALREVGHRPGPYRSRTAAPIRVCDGSLSSPWQLHWDR